MTPLPEPVAAPLHILPPWIGIAAFLLVLALICAALVALLWRRLRRRRHLPGQGSEPSRAPGADGGFGGLVDELRDSHVARRAYRDGCHALSTAVKTLLERRFGFSAEEMTAAEIGSVVGRPPVKRFLGELRDHQFGRRPPRRKDFEKMCRSAKKLLSRRDVGAAPEGG